MKALKNKRQIGFGGLFKEIRKELQLEDVENGDLVHVDEDNDDTTLGTEIVAIWNWERKNYFVQEMMMNMTKLNIEILTNADYLHFGSLKIVGFDNLTFRFDSSGKLMADFWDDRDGYHEMREDEQFYKDIQKALTAKLLVA